MVIIQVNDQIKIRLISQLIKGILRVFQILLKYFNGNSIFASFVLPSAEDFPVIFTLTLNEALSPEKLSRPQSSSLKYFHTPSDVFE